MACVYCMSKAVALWTTRLPYLGIGVSLLLLLLTCWRSQVSLNSRAHKFNSISVTPPGDFSSRLLRYRKVCQSFPSLPGQVGTVFIHEQSGAIYCHVPKAGCTFWKRAFKFVNNKVYGFPIHPLTRCTVSDPVLCVMAASTLSLYCPFFTSESIFSTTRYDIHFKDKYLESTYSWLGHNPYWYPVRLVVARDPLMRVLSTYLDKFYLPDFWFGHGRTFTRRIQRLKAFSSAFEFLLGKRDSEVKTSGDVSEIIDKYRHKFDIEPRKAPQSSKRDFLKIHLRNIYERFDREETWNSSKSINKTNNFEGRSGECGKYLSFEEFVHTSITDQEMHWEPTHKVCNPCQFQPTHVSYMSTFTSDAKVVLSLMGHEHVLDDFDPVAQVDEELRMLVEFFFTAAYSGIHQEFYEKCLTPRELAYRLWHNFAWRGYIHPDVIYVTPRHTAGLTASLVMQDLLRQLREARSRGLQDPAAVRRARQAFYRRVFSTLTHTTLVALIKKHRFDFMLFGDP